MQTYYAPGKILLAGEYGVMLGLEGHAVPVNRGQWLEFFEFATPNNQPNRCYFKAIDDQDQAWIQGTFSLDSFSWETDRTPELDLVESMFHLVPKSFWKPNFSYRLETKLEFSRNSGLGSSSTFVALMSQCFNLNPQWLQEQLFNGSGYDVAVASLRKPVTFWRNETGAHFKSWRFAPEIGNDWKVVFLGEKVNSRHSASEVLGRFAEVLQEPFYRLQIEKALQMIQAAESTLTVEAALELYQLLLAQLLEMPTPYEHFELKAVKRGLCKWLGAWGGDMLLINATFETAYPEFVSSYESISWNELIIHA